MEQIIKVNKHTNDSVEVFFLLKKKKKEKKGIYLNILHEQNVH